jgi:hypothetical protein
MENLEIKEEVLVNEALPPQKELTYTLEEGRVVANYGLFHAYGVDEVTARENLMDFMHDVAVDLHSKLEKVKEVLG